MRLIDADEIRIKPKYMHDICGSVMIRVEDIARIINDMPTIDQQKWIPIYERLPNEQDYIPCYEAPNGVVWYCTSEGLIGLGWYYESTWEWANLNNEAIVGDVIAWMPLPKPYQ